MRPQWMIVDAVAIISCGIATGIAILLILKIFFWSREPEENPMSDDQYKAILKQSNNGAPSSNEPVQEPSPLGD